MLEHLPWIIGGLAVGLFVGYALGKYKGASEVSEDLGLEKNIAGARPGKAAARSSQAGAESGKMVYIRRGGSHYHKEGCGHLRRRGSQQINKAEAIKKGFKRCPHCHP